jgi:predicted phosphodiesterase
MRLAVLSDVHANLEALRAALALVERLGADRVVSCGDLVGYNADPNAVVDTIRERGIASVMGNHDAVAAGLEEPDGFNAVAREAIFWTRRVLSDENREFLAGLPARFEAGPGLLLVHGSFLERDTYLFEPRGAARDLDGLERKRPDVSIVFFGHTHDPVVFSRGVGGSVEEDREERVRLQPDRKHLVNPGSVGQPRDGDPRLSLAILDEERGVVERHRAAYPVEEAAEKVRRAGLPPHLAVRLALGR